MEYKLNNWEVIEIAEYRTRKIAREFNDHLLKWSTVSATWEVSIDATNSEKANDYLVWAMTGLTQNQIDELSDKEFKDILSKINSEESTPSGEPAK